MLYVITSKIQKFIKSQRRGLLTRRVIAVCNHIKDTKIHQITTGGLKYIFLVELYVITSKIQKFIKSQPFYISPSCQGAVCNHIKDTKIHQITTNLLHVPLKEELYVITSKIQKFIKSQPTTR